jgi:hypothetical protein
VARGTVSLEGRDDNADRLADIDVCVSPTGAPQHAVTDGGHDRLRGLITEAIDVCDAPAVGYHLRTAAQTLDAVEHPDVEVTEADR